MQRFMSFSFLVVFLFIPIFVSEVLSDKREEKEAGKSQEKIMPKKRVEEKVLGEMVLLSGGTFWMGLDEKEASKAYELGIELGIQKAAEKLEAEMPRHAVTLKPFYIDKYEVTNQQFARFVSETGYEAQGNWSEFYTREREKHPVVGVTWFDARAYAEWAGKRLPTEAEWEFAARGGLEGQLFPWGDSISKDLANYSNERTYPFTPIHTREVGSYPANAFGIYDMSGNVGEWCADWFDERFYSESPERDPGGPDSGEKMVVRGGAWGTTAFYLRVSSRGSFDPHHYDYRIGFRCARSLDR